MKKKNNVSAFLSGMFVMLLLVSLALPAVAASAEQIVSVFTNVKVYVNDMPIDAGDLNGNPEAFIYNGTTYIPVRAVSNSLGQDVKWDGTTRSVYVGKHAGSSAHLLDVCPPYQKSYIETPATVTMAGEKYANCMTMYGWYEGYCYATFNLNGKYDKLSFDAGHIDGAGMASHTVNIYLDGSLAFSVDLNPEMLPRHFDVPLNGALQMKIECLNGNGNGTGRLYALANLSVE